MRFQSGITDQYVYFVAVDSTDFTTRETGLSSFTVYRSRNGAASAAMTTPTVNETDTTNMPGVYELLLDEDMTIAAGNDSEAMVFHITHASMAPVTLQIELYRPKITAGNTLGVESDGDLTKVNTLDGHTAQTGDSFARIGAAGASLTDLGGMSTAMKAEVNAECDTALTDYDAVVPADLNDPTAAAIADAVLDEALSGHTSAGTLGKAIADIEADTNELQTDDVPGLIAALNDPTAAVIADAVWDEVLTGASHNDSTSAGRRLRQASEIISTDSAVDDPGAAATTTVFNTDLTEVNDFYNDCLVIFTSGSLTGQARPILDYANTNGQITLDEPLTSAPSDNDAFIIYANHVHPVDQIADRVLDEALSEHTTAGSLGKAVADIEADTNELQGDWVDGGRLDLIIDSILLDTSTTLNDKIDTIDGIVDDILVDTGTTIPASIAALNDLSAAEVNTEVVDALNVDAYGEPTGVPAVSASIQEKLGRLYMVMRNKEATTASKHTIYDDSGTAEWEYDVSDDGTTFTKTEANAI